MIAAGANEIVGEVLAIFGPEKSAHFLVVAFVLLHERLQLILSVGVHAREKLLSFDVVRIRLHNVSHLFISDMQSGCEYSKLLRTLTN